MPALSLAPPCRKTRAAPTAGLGYASSIPQTFPDRKHQEAFAEVETRQRERPSERRRRPRCGARRLWVLSTAPIPHQAASLPAHPPPQGGISGPRRVDWAVRAPLRRLDLCLRVAWTTVTSGSGAGRIRLGSRGPGEAGVSDGVDCWGAEPTPGRGLPALRAP